MRALLRFYPRQLREEFGDEMADFLYERRRRSAERGRLATIRFWIATIADLARSRWGTSPRPVAARRSPADRLASVRADIGSGFRFLLKAPASTIAIVSLLAITLAAATLVFSVVNAVLIRPLPFGDPSRLVVVWEKRDGRSDRNAVSGHEFPEWSRRARAFDRLTGVAFPGAMTLTGSGEPAALNVVRVTAGFAETMGVRPIVGRSIRDDELAPGRGGVALLSYRLWRERFGANADVLGTRILLEGRPFEVVGVMPATFKFPPPSTDVTVTPDVWLPLDEPIHLYRGRHFLYVLGRLRPDAALADAQADMDRVTGDLRAELPDLNRGHGALVVPLHDDLVRGWRASLLLVFGAVGCLLLIGCGNVAGLLIARGLARRREVSLRLALGAAPGRIARQLLTESLALAIAGGLLGIAAAVAIARALPSLVPAAVLPLESVPLDRTVLLFALTATIGTGLLFGIAPAMQLGRVPLTDALGRTARSVKGGDASRSRRFLVVAQVGLTIVLVLSAGALVRALAALHAIDPGFRPDGVLAIDVSLSNAGYPAPARQRQFFVELTARLRVVPGVDTVSTVNAVPLGGAISGISIGLEGRPAPPPGQDRSARYRIVGPGYFRTMQIPVRAGREFTDADARLAVPLIRWFPQQPIPAQFDRPQPPPVAVINESMAKEFWPNENPIGRRFTVLLSPPVEIVGIVADTYNDSLRERPIPEFYLTDVQDPQRTTTVLVRTTGNPIDMAPVVRSVVRQMDAGVALGSIRTLDRLVANTFGLARFTSGLVTAFASIALLLMSAGIYGLMAFATARRIPEIGVRLALGAKPSSIRRMVVRDGLILAGLGSMLGLAFAWAARGWMRAQFVDAAPPDALMMATVTVVIAAATIAACWLPARRAAHTDPVVVLRQE